jgi:ribonuclease HII
MSHPRRGPGTLNIATSPVNDAPVATAIGVDENGLGPRLGPLVVTAVWAQTWGKGHDRAQRKPRGALGRRLGDSKKLAHFGDTTVGEAWARAIATRTGLTAGPPENPDALIRALSIDTAENLRVPCPEEHAEQCWSTTQDQFLADPELVTEVERDLCKLEMQGVRVLQAACVVVCARRLNDAAARGSSRFDLDLHAMERLTLFARARVGHDVVATCGKVGGFDRYVPAFGPMSGWPHTVAIESRARSEYSVPGLGRIAFVRDADERHLLVCMASLVGKWVRDVLTARVVRYHREADPELTDASGYHDPVTARFIEASRLSREKRGLPDDCFERRARSEKS